VFFILEGRIGLVDNNGYIFKSYVEGSYFGEIEIIDKTVRDANAIAEQNCEILLIKKKDFKKIMNDFPEVYQEIVKVSTLRKQKNRDAMIAASKNNFMLDERQFEFILPK
jgi:CRP-like cAMP-binding protein